MKRVERTSTTATGASAVGSPSGKSRSVGRSFKVRTLAVCGIAAALLAAGALGHAEGPSELTDDQMAHRLGVTTDQVRLLHDYRKLTNAALLEMPRGRVDRILWKLEHPHPDLPLEAARFRELQQVGVKGQVAPENALGKAIAKVREMRKAVVTKAVPAAPQAAAPAGIPGMIAAEAAPMGRPVFTVAGMPVGPMVSAPPPPAPAPPGGVAPAQAPIPASPAAGILQLDLEALPAAVPPRPLGVAPAAAPAPGPGGISPTGWKWLGPGNIGGRTRSIVIHPTNPSIMWLGAVTGGVWKSTNGGQSWGPLADFMASLNVCCMVLDPTNPEILFAGTGEGYYNIDAFRGAGIFRSGDGGATWTQISATTGPQFHFVNRLALSADGKVLLAATRTGVYRCENVSTAGPGELKFAPATGLNVDILDVDFHPTNAQLGIAGGRGGRAYYTTDGGKSWHDAGGGLPTADFAATETFGGRVELTYARNDPSVVYASIDHNQGELYRSTDGGRTYELRAGLSGFLSAQGWYDNAIWAGDPTDAGLVVVGGVDLYRSADGGMTGEQISEWWRAPASAHADNHVIVAHPQYNGTTNRIVYFGNDGGIYRNADVRTATPTTGWLALNNNYGVTQFYGAAGNRTSGRVVGGTQDNGTLLYVPPPGSNTGPQGYTAMFGGDGGWCAADPVNANFMYGEYVNLQIHRSVNGGGSGSFIFGGSQPIEDAGSSAGALFIAPFILDPNDPRVLLAGGSRLWRSKNVRDSTPSWSPIKAAVSSGALISAVEARRGGAGVTGPGASNLLWVGYTDGQVYRSTDGTKAKPTWTRVDEGTSPLPDRYCTRLRIDRANVQRVYACFSGYTAGNIWKTTDGGSTWTDIGTSLPEASVYDVAIHPQNPNFLYLATEVGVFSSSDGGSTWAPTNQGPANVATYELFWMGTNLIAATHGRGIFWISLPVTGPAVPPAFGVAGAAGATGGQAAVAPAGERDAPAGVIATDPANSR